MILSVCLMASLAIVGCKKDPKGNDQEQGDNQNEDNNGEEEDTFEPLIKIDGDFADWADITGVEMDGSNYAGLKVAMDERNIYFYSKRMTTGRFNDLWGGTGYYYFGFDLDGEEGNGSAELYGNAGYDLLLLYFPFAGTPASEGVEFAPAFGWPEATGEASNNEASPADYSVEGSTVAGKYTAPVGDDPGYVETEICTPLENLPEIPNRVITINSWGNKDANHIILEKAI